MRLNMTQQGGLADEFMSGGGSVINPLFLAADPAVPLGASTKQYVDNSAASLNANNLITGTIGAARFPAMNGDLTSSAGSTTLTLSNTGVTPGAYPKVSVDNKGRVLNGLNLVESDLPAMSWNKITFDKPTTIDGYGITNAIKSTGGTMVGAISVNGTPTQSTQLVNKSYLDTVVGGTTGIAVGDIISKIDPSTPVGFLKCNGAELVKTSYQDLYNAIGDRYTTLSKPGNGKPWQNQYDINTENLGDLMSGRSAGTLPGTLGGAAVFVTKNRIYVYGGYNGSTYLGIGYTAAINNDGTLGTWSAATTLPSVYCYSTAIVTKNKVYLIGGYLNGSTATNAIFVADINADGTIGTWGNGPNLPATVSYSHAFINVNKLYVVGGYNGSPLNSLYSAEIKDDGSLANWSTETNLPITVYQSTLLVIKNKVYLLGGYQNSVASSAIYSAALNSDGSIGTWSIDSYLPITFASHQGIVTRNVIYIFGGLQNGTTSSNIYRAEIRTDGTIGSWQLQTWTLQGPVSNTNVAIVKSKVYILGGWNGSVWNANCYVSDIAGGMNDYSSFYSNMVETNFMVAGSGKPWQQQYQINATQTGDITGWITDSSVLPVSLSNSTSIVTKNYVYLIGGSTGASNVIVNSVYKAAINTDGTLGEWVADINFPIAIYLACGVVVGNKAYIFGGSSTDLSTARASIYNATINNDGTLGAWTIYNTSLVTAVTQSNVIITRNKIHLIGGRTGISTYTSTIQSAIVYPDGNLSNWSSTGSLPVSFADSQSVITKNRVYLLGGYNGSALSTIYTAPINSDGTLGSWSNSGNLPTIHNSGQIFVTANIVYLIGGTSYSTVYYATINSDGIIGSWQSGTSIPGVCSGSQLIITKNRIYLLGGHNATNISTIYSAPILEGLNDYSAYYAGDNVNYMLAGSGRPWENQYQFNTTQSGDITGWTTSATGVMSIGIHVCIVTKNRVYVGAGNSNIMYTAPINSDGSIGTWTSLGAVLPVSPQYASAVVTKNRAFIIGSTGTNAILTAPINADGTLGAWSSLTGTPVSFSFTTTFVTNKKLYVLSGSGAGTVIYYANINDDGTLGGWVQSAYAFPISTNLAKALVTKNRVYIIGGNQGGPSTGVWTAAILPDGTVGNWVAGPSLLFGVEAPLIIATKNTVIIGGGYYAFNAMTNVSQIATINDDGTIGNWSYGTVFPMSFHSCTPIITNGKVHLIGGAIGTGVVNGDIYTAPFLGGMNDYSSYMNGDIVPAEQFVTVSKFNLPDASFMNDGLNYFIKY